ncbi:hypothetical protein C5S32_10675 [ANME-1 cluster archaeon GoMg1]|nr:hypothetical protein [ANME-1 cluster archaeon GoMg1]
MFFIIAINKPQDSTRLTQHFFFFTKRKPVLKEKTKKVFFGKLINNLVKICVIWWLILFVCLVYNEYIYTVMVLYAYVMR